MKKKRKEAFGKFLSLLLSAAMVFTMLPVNAYAVTDVSEWQYDEETDEAPSWDHGGEGDEALSWDYGEENDEAVLVEEEEAEDDWFMELVGLDGEGEEEQLTITLVDDLLNEYPSDIPKDENGNVPTYTIRVVDKFYYRQYNPSNAEISVKNLSPYAYDEQTGENTMNIIKIEVDESSLPLQWTITGGDAAGDALITVTATDGTDYVGTLKVSFNYYPYGYEPVPITSSDDDFYVDSVLACDKGFGVPVMSESAYSYQWWYSEDGSTEADKIQEITGAQAATYKVPEEYYNKFIGCTITVDGESYRTKTPRLIYKNPWILLTRSNISDYREALADQDAELPTGGYGNWMLKLDEDIELTEDLVIRHSAKFNFAGHTLTVPDGIYFGVVGEGNQIFLEDMTVGDVDAKGKLVGKLQSDGTGSVEFFGADFRKADFSELDAEDAMLHEGVFSFDPWNPLDPDFPPNLTIGYGYDTYVNAVEIWNMGSGTTERYFYACWAGDMQNMHKLAQRHTNISGNAVVGETLTALPGWYLPYILRETTEGAKTWHYEWRRLSRTEVDNGYGWKIGKTDASLGEKVGRGETYAVTEDDLGSYLVVDIISDDKSTGCPGYGVFGPIAETVGGVQVIDSASVVVEISGIADDNFIGADGEPSADCRSNVLDVAGCTVVKGLDNLAYDNEDAVTELVGTLRTVAEAPGKFKELIGDSAKQNEFMVCTGVDLDSADYDASKLNILVQPVTVVTPVNGSHVAGERKFTMDIKAALRMVVAQAGVQPKDVVLGSNAVAVGPLKEIPVTIPVKIEMGGYFYQSWKKAAITLTQEGSEYRNFCKINYGISFASEHGLGRFEFAESNSDIAAMVGNVSYNQAQMEEAVLAAMEQDKDLTLYEDMSVSVNRKGTLKVRANGNFCKINVGEGLEIYTDEQGVLTVYTITEAGSKECVATFMYNLPDKGIVTSKKVTKNGRIEKPADPSAEGFTFDGWFKEAACTTAWDFDKDTVTADVTLYAKWTPKGSTSGNTTGGDVSENKTEYTVTYDLQGHGAAISADKVEKDGKVTKPADPTAEGFAFGGWFRESACTSAWDFAKDTVSANITLYAKWTEDIKTFTVKFDLQGHGAAIADVTVKDGEKVAKPADPTAAGFIFGGWFKESACTTAWDFAADTVKADATVYAKWTEDKSTVTPEDVEDKYYDVPTVVKKDIKAEGAVIDPIKGKTYDGNPYMPAVKVKIGKTVLTEGVDYRVVYKNNVNAGKGSVIVKGNGVYTGELPVQDFEIAPKSVRKLKVAVGGMKAGASVNNLPIYIYDGGTMLEAGVDYDITGVTAQLTKEEGTPSVTIKGKGNYEGEKPVKLTVYAADKILIQDSDVVLSFQSATFTGKAIKPDVTVTVSGQVLGKKDCTVKIENNKNVGTAYVTVTGKKDYRGCVVKTFEIKPVEAKFDLKKDLSAVTYSGKLQKPKMTVTVKGKTLKLNKDYYVLYSNNLHAGTATATIVGIGNYEGLENKPVPFTIKPQDIKKASVKGTWSAGIQVLYNKHELQAGIDYTVEDVKEAGNKAEVTLKGKNDFTGDVVKKVKK